MEKFLKGGQAKQKDDQQMSDIDQNSKAFQSKKFVPWIEKYRPSRIEEVSHQIEAVAALKKSIENKQVPHLLFYGPPGTGKTSTILALAKELFGKELYKTRVKELNASDDRGIQVVREKIKKFAQRKVTKIPDKDCPSLQIIILDEADSMTIDAQSALRRIIEQYSTTTRFCIICNYLSKIIDPLASRCVKFRFTPISKDAQIDRLKFICEQEQVSLDGEKVLQRLVEISEGDLRRSINMLQTASSFKKSELNLNDVNSISGVVPNDAIQKMERILLVPGKEIIFEEIHTLASELILDGFDVQQLFSQFLETVVQSNLICVKKSKISEILAECDIKVLQGGDEELNLTHALVSIGQVVREV